MKTIGIFDEFDQERIVFSVILLGLGLFAIIGLWNFLFPIDTDRASVYGCFESRHAGVIEAGPAGLRLEGVEGNLIVPFELIWSRGYKVQIDGSVALMPSEDGYRWKTHPRGWSYLMPFDGEPGIFTEHQTDPTKLDRFSVFVTGAEGEVVFDRTDLSRCDFD